MKKYISMFVLSLLAVSCIDTVILPDDKTVDEDFWKSKSDVQLMVNGAYQSLLSTDVVTRLIVWSGLRSDELVVSPSMDNVTARENLTQMRTANVQYDNPYASWTAFYKVINNCNLVLAKAAGVMQEDPSYTEGDYLADCSQMLALRSLCYFYLVRNYRDVPYSDEAFMISSQNLDLPQMAPDAVLAHCISDLEIAERNAISPRAYSDWRRVGYITTDAIDALLADIYLWRASVTHNAADYEKAVEYCDKVIESKKQQHRLATGNNEFDDYPLATGREAFDELFVSMNAEESIFELQFDGAKNSNTAVCEFYNRYAEKKNDPYVVAPNFFAKGGAVFTSATQTSVTDYRSITTTYSGADDNMVRKFVADERWPNLAASSSQQLRRLRDYKEYRQNFIIYRLTDVMLIKAEALCALATDDDDLDHLRAAFAMVEPVNTRSLDNASNALKFNTYNTVQKLEELILNERLRELAFEGKRWYDLLRYNYRHSEGVNYGVILADQKEQGIAFASTYRPSIDLMVRYMGSGSTAVASKMSTEPSLYLPVPKSDLEICPVLKQNPVYGTNDIYEKNIK